MEDINNSESSLYEQFLSFESRTSNRYQNIIKNLQYFHQCSDSAAKWRKGGDERVIVSVNKEEEETGIETDINKPPHIYTEKDLEAALQPKCTQEERLYTKIGMRIPKEAGVFNENLTMFLPKPVLKQAKQEDSIHHLELEQIVKMLTKERFGEQHNVTSEENVHPLLVRPSSMSVLDDLHPILSTRPNDTEHENWLTFLNTEQRCAHDIIISHMNANQAGRSPKQMLMIVIGPGGTGKSTLLNAITKSFEHNGVCHLLAKTAMSGVAATVIGGTTLHWWAGLLVMKTPNNDDWMDHKSTSKEIKARRDTNITNTDWLAIDEISMLTTDLITLTSQITGFVKTGVGTADSTVPFGGMNVLLLGDFHQFPPVANPSGALYSTLGCSQKETTTRVVGWNIYHQFQTMVALKQQMWIMDQVWSDILE